MRRHRIIPSLIAATSLFSIWLPAASAGRAPAVTAIGNGRIAFVSARDGNNEIYTMHFDGLETQNVSNAPSSSDTQPAWSPDGTRIAFTSDRGGKLDVWVMDALGTNPVRLTTDPGSNSQPAWSPDGTKIAFTSDRSGNPDVWVMDALGTNPVQLTTDPGSDSQPAWSPDGTRIAFTSDRGGNDDVFTMTASGTAETNLTNAAGNDSNPVYSPDGGTRVAFQASRDGNNEVYASSVPNGSVLQEIVPANLTHVLASDTDPSWQPLPPYLPANTPIQHVVVIYEENHSFDNVLGKLCVIDARCDGVTTGLLPDGSSMNLLPATDHVVGAGHNWTDHVAAIDGGKMDGWPNVNKCSVVDNLACYQQFDPSQIPTITSLARTYALSDRTFESDPTASWGSHLVLGSSYLDGFYHAIVHPDIKPGYKGWGCDSGDSTDWWDSRGDTHPTTELTCVPAKDGTGPRGPSPVPWVPTLFDRMDSAGVPWGLYAYNCHTDKPCPGYGWSICPTFGECLNGPDWSKWHRPSQFAGDALAGNLPAVSLLLPANVDSAHNGQFMSIADNWINTNVSAVMNGPDWATTAIFITFDDCGCFYDHVRPPAGTDYGLRTPMIIVSPFARRGFTDSGIAGMQVSMQAFIEHVFGLAPLSPRDAEAYDYFNAFDFSQLPIPSIQLPRTPIPAWKYRWSLAHPPPVGTPDD